jgi:hypothetical protein
VLLGFAKKEKVITKIKDIFLSIEGPPFYMKQGHICLNTNCHPAPAR